MISDDHPITPPLWVIDARFDETDNSCYDDAKFFARWGADEQLGVCLKWLQDHGYDLAAPELKKHCRPAKPQPPKTVVVDGHTYHLAE
jgi:hypothetical protein